MQKLRRLLPPLMTLALGVGAGDVAAIGWGPATQAAVIGRPLDFTASLRLDPGDAVAGECVHADVSLGDQQMPPVGVRLGVDTSQPEAVVMRVVTVRPVDEPVVTVVLSVGCPSHMSRRFVLLADPPDLVAAQRAAAAPRPVPPMLAAPVIAERPDPVVTERRLPAAVAQAEPKRAPAHARATSPTRRVRRAPPAATPTVAAAAAPRPRLQLDPAPPEAVALSPAAASAVEAALQAVAQAAQAARSAASAASSAQQRVSDLEQEVARLRREADAGRQAVGEMRGRVALAEEASRWLWPLALLTAVFAALAGWLAWRLRQVQEQRLRAWRAEAQAAERPPTPTSQLPLVTSEIMQPPPYPARPAAVGRGLAVPAPAADTELDTVPQVERTEVQEPAPAVATTTDPGAARDVSIEELLDLEQQAEFFIVLGQDEAAIDLLVDHVRDTGGGSPLPYLKLLEIYRRRDDREAYERTRTRFNHRFNAYAPEWDADLGEGRSLEDYPGVVPRLQQVWSRPLDAMAELEALLFRKSRGQLFDLPAYREVLFLYSLARDLLDREGADSGNVDLLLPLADGSEFGVTTPKPYLALEHDSVFDHLHDTHADDRPTSPIDLDLTQPDDGPTSIVDPLTPRR